MWAATFARSHYSRTDDRIYRKERKRRNRNFASQLTPTTTTGVHQDVIEPFVVSSTVESDHTWICYSTNSKRLLWPRVYWHGTLQASDIPSPSKCLWGAIRKISEAHHPRHAAKLFSGCHPQLLLFYLWQISSDCE